jgi:tetratricopeptide (TPR) repeat protein
MEVELGLGHRLDEASNRGFEHDPMLRCRAMKRLVRRVVMAALWLAVAVLIAFGAAGIVGGMAQPPGTQARAELTWAGDTAIDPGLDAAEADLLLIAGDVHRLSDLGREALGQLVGRDVEGLEAAVDEGEQLTLQIQLRSNAVRQALEGLPGVGPNADLVLSPESQARHARALAALENTEGLAPAWSTLASGALAATRVQALLTDHDQVAAEAAADGRGGRYEEALAKLDEADAMIAEARELRDDLAATVDVATLTTWLDLNADYDAALRQLYQAILDANGRVNAEVRAAFDAELVARERLPENTRGLVIILADIGQGGLNQAVIAIERARGGLDTALAEIGDTGVSHGPDAEEGPSAAP